MTDTAASTLAYGNEPMLLGTFELDWAEYVTYQYLPIQVPDNPRRKHVVEMPRRLSFAWPLVEAAYKEEVRRGNNWSHVYVTAKRGFATPGNPLNRPGWHADGFGTPDVNYVWVDRFPTLFAVGEFPPISGDHIESVRDFERAIGTAAMGAPGYRWSRDEKIEIREYPDKMLLRLDPSVVHAAPEIPAPGGERSFFKVSFSNDRYDLLGNAHNYALDYDWPMVPRGFVRNDPASAGRDSSKKETS